MRKNYTSTLFKKYALVFATALLALISACKSGNETQITIGTLSVYNASPSYSTYDVYLNGSKLNAAALPFGGGVKYTQLPTGTYDAKFTVAGSADAVYTKSSIAVGENTFSTLYLLGTASNFESLLVADNFGTPATDKAYVRFINLSPDAPALDLGIKEGSSIATGKTYKTYSEFTAVDAGAKIFEIKESASGTVKSTLASETLTAGNFYTVISRGKLTPAGELERPFSGQVILHR